MHSDILAQGNVPADNFHQDTDPGSMQVAGNQAIGGFVAFETAYIDVLAQLGNQFPTMFINAGVAANQLPSQILRQG